MRGKLSVRLRNLAHAHERWMARFLRRRGWVAFYLEEQSRECRGLCWLKIYQQDTGFTPFNNGARG